MWRRWKIHRAKLPDELKRSRQSAVAGMCWVCVSQVSTFLNYNMRSPTVRIFMERPHCNTNNRKQFGHLQAWPTYVLERQKFSAIYTGILPTKSELVSAESQQLRALSICRATFASIPQCNKPIRQTKFKNFQNTSTCFQHKPAKQVQTCVASTRPLSRHQAKVLATLGTFGICVCVSELLL